MLSISFIVIGYACTLTVANDMMSGIAFEDPFNTDGHNYFVPSSFSGKSDYSPPAAKHYNPPSARGHAYNPVPAPPKYNPSPQTPPSYVPDRHPAPAPPTYNNPSQNPPSYESILHHARAPPVYNPPPQALRSNHLGNFGKKDVSQSYHSSSGSNHAKIPAPRYNSGLHRMHPPRGSPPSIYPASKSYNPPSGGSYVNAPSSPSYNPPAQPSYGPPSSNPSGRSYGREPAPPSHSYENDASSSQNGFIHESSESFLIHPRLHDMPYKDAQPPQYEIPVLHHRTSSGTKRKGKGRTAKGKQQVYGHPA